MSKSSSLAATLGEPNSKTITALNQVKLCLDSMFNKLSLCFGYAPGHIDQALALPTDIRKAQKDLPMTNGLAYLVEIAENEEKS